MPNLKVIHTETQLTGEINTTANGASISLDGAVVFSAQCNADVDTPALKTFTDTDVSVADDTITITAHGFITGDKGQFSSTGTLPAGLSTSTDYFIIKVDANTIKVATSLANALLGTALNITGQGTVAATNTFTPTAIAGGSVKLQKSNDGTNWSDEGSATNITADGLVWLEKIDPCGLFMRLQFTLTAGQMSVSSVVVTKGYN
jgi:hypothetical protein